MYAIAIHGGAGTLPRGELSTGREHEYRAGLSEALSAGIRVLEAGGGSVEAVTEAVMLLENCPLFNAGRGSVFTYDGHNELDAAIMNGANLAAGAVCAVRRIANPIALARSVMEKSDFVMLNGEGAEEFARVQGFEFVAPEYFHTQERWNQLQKILGGDRNLSPLTISHIGTVGAVALDSRGNLASATSTGGMTGKRYGRIGDSPIIGAGTYADNRSCAVSATGHGEKFICATVAHDIAARLRYGGRGLEQAVREVIHGELPAIHGDGGVIAVDARGAISMQFNTEGMFRASARAGEEPVVAIYDD
jgi:L-asparaginase / beta-aspartyl-peptidase